jgi:enoyl-CoA hydratase/carnithine racemase
MSLLEISSSDDAISTIVLNRPEKKNALSIALRDEFTAALDSIASDGTTKVVVVTGAGSAFSAGFDLSEFQRPDDPDHTRTLWESSDRFHHACLGFPLPMIAAVNGLALAGGFDLAVMCDVRIAATSARFAHPERTFGDIVYSPLHDLVGGAVARDLALSGRPVMAEEALRLGLVSQVVPDADLPAVAAAYAVTVAEAPRRFLIRTKAKIIARAHIDMTPTLDL